MSPKDTVNDIATNMFHFAANLESRATKGEEFPKDEILAIVGRVQDYAADLQVAASQLPSE